ncbi:metal ABC transporter substrate-binding protein [Rapidithrix thailandica]|uniref:Metal ABC transporter substrate-binding protein n=1 Tax=Rapidithrix thailandica TaxID=413964 RepID=A0AAW9RRY8_9BACT
MKRIFLFLLIGVSFYSCKKKQKQETADNTPENKTPVVASVNYPLHYFAQQIGGDLIETIYPVAENADPAYWQPEVEDVELYQQADIILTNGAGYAKWMKKVSLPESKLVNTSDAFHHQYIESGETITHSHGPGGEHTHKGIANTTWLNFKFALQQAEAVKEALIRKLPNQKQALEANFETLKKELVQLDEQMQSLSSQLEDKNLFGSHPVYQYLAKGYALKIVSEHWEPGQIPSEEQWEAFQHNLHHHPAKIMLWEGEALQETQNTLNDHGVKPVVFNPCGNKPVSGDFISMMKTNIENLERAALQKEVVN